MDQPSKARTDERFSIERLPESVQNLIRHLSRSNDVVKIVIFGSQARRSASAHSDYDFALWTKDRQAWSRLRAEIEELNLTLLPVDLLLYEEGSPEIRARIDAEGIVIYEQA